jgi:Periplasmic protease
MAVLINGATLFASEIVAGVLQDYYRAIVLGSQSFGKGLVQTVIGINQETALKITNSKYYIPSGRSLQKREFIDDELIANSSVVADTLFQTKAGRTVIGGGGIGPDVIVKDEGSYPLAASILRSRGYFKFVQENNNQYSSIDEVLADEELMVKFKTFIEKNDISGYVDGQEDLKLAKEKLSKKEEKNLFINNAFSVIEKQIEKTQSTMFEDEKEIIQRMVHGEFAFYYNGYEGRYNIYLKDDTVVQKAIEIFADESQYLSILSNTESTEVASLNN